MSERGSGSYTAAQLLAAAAAAGLPRSGAWIRTLVRDGLLDQPDKHGVEGQRGGRQSGTWPQEQWMLFHALLAQMTNGVTRVGQLCNVPVGFWLYVPESTVPVRQVRRALRTYGGAHRTSSKRAGQATARRAAEVFAGGVDMSRSDREQLIRAVVKATQTGRLDREALITNARRLFDPENIGRTAGPIGARLNPEAWVDGIDAHLTALDQLESLPEDAFEAARHVQNQAVAGYAERQPAFARDHQAGRLFEPVTVDWMFQNACLHTLAVLGFQHLTRNNPRARRSPVVPPSIAGRNDP